MNSIQRGSYGSALSQDRPATALDYEKVLTLEVNHLREKTRIEQATNEPELLDAAKKGWRYKNWRVIKYVLQNAGIEFRYNTRIGSLEIDETFCNLNQEPILTRGYMLPARGWHMPGDEWDGWLVDHMRENYLWRGISKDARTTALNFSSTAYHSQMWALCGQKLHQVDPLLEYAHECSLKWDGTPRLDTLMCHLFGCEEDERVAWFSKYLFMGPLWRSLKPGYKLDTLPVLAGKQSLRKSSFLAQLLPGELRGSLFTGSANLGNRDDEIIGMCRGKAIIEVAELSGIYKKELKDLKAFIALPSDTFRPKYARRHIDLPRMWIVVGTADRTDDIIPNDPAGNRRWPVLELPGNEMKGQERLNALDEIRDQLWGEAWTRVYTKREDCYWTDEYQEKYGKIHAAHATYDDPLEQLIIDELEYNPSERGRLITAKGKEAYFFSLRTLPELLQLVPLIQVDTNSDIVSPPAKIISQADRNRMNEALRSRGFFPWRCRDGGRQCRGWAKYVKCDKNVTSDSKNIKHTKIRKSVKSKNYIENVSHPVTLSHDHYLCVRCKGLKSWKVAPTIIDNEYVCRECGGGGRDGGGGGGGTL